MEGSGWEWVHEVFSDLDIIYGCEWFVFAWAALCFDAKLCCSICHVMLLLIPGGYTEFALALPLHVKSCMFRAIRLRHCCPQS